MSTAGSSSNQPGPIAQQLAKVQPGGQKQVVAAQQIPITHIPASKRSHFAWTGFSGKSLWDWLQLLAALAIPIIVAAGTIYFSYEQNQTSLQLSDKQHNSDQMIAIDQQREATLTKYLDDVKDALLHQGLLISQENSSIRTITRAETLSTLQRLDGPRKRIIIKFLAEANLSTNASSFVNVPKNVDPQTFFPIVSLSGADLSNTDLSGVNLYGAVLALADLSGTDLRGAHLASANLSYANLEGANLEGADLGGANFYYAFLEKARVTEEQLSKVASLKHATMPDGTTHS